MIMHHVTKHNFSWTTSQSPLECHTMEDSPNECTADKSVANMSSNHVNMDQNLKGIKRGWGFDSMVVLHCINNMLQIKYTVYWDYMDGTVKKDVALLSWAPASWIWVIYSSCLVGFPQVLLTSPKNMTLGAQAMVNCHCMQISMNMCGVLWTGIP